MPKRPEHRTYRVQAQWKDAGRATFHIRATHALDALRQFRKRLSYDEGVGIERLLVDEAEAKEQSQ